jgi:hypothetical protein
MFGITLTHRRKYILDLTYQRVGLPAYYTADLSALVVVVNHPILCLSV